MEKLFLELLNMSCAASYVIAAVLLLRLLLKKAPRRYSYVLWSAAAFRLCCPVSLSAGFSLFGLLDLTQRGAALDFIPENLGMMAQPEVHTGLTAVNTVLRDSLPAASPANSANPMQIVIFIASVLWCAGAAALALYGLFSYLALRRRLCTATRLEDNVFESAAVRSPFVLGVLRPKIYLPYGLDGESRAFVLAHERYHLKRKDPLVRLFAFCLLALHWFNPLVWIAFSCMSRDMEMSCDEKVLENGGAKAYSLCLLSVASGRRFPAPGPLAFGETGVKSRIRHALAWKKPRRWAAAAAVVLCTVTILACSVNPLQAGGYDGSYHAGKTVLSSALLSYLPPSGDARGLESIVLADGKLTVTAQTGWRYESDAVEIDTLTREEMVQAMDVGLLLGYEEDENGGYSANPEALPDLIPAYSRAKDMVVIRTIGGQWTEEGASSEPTMTVQASREGQTEEEIPAEFQLFFFRGEPLWLMERQSFVYLLERVE